MYRLGGQWAAADYQNTAVKHKYNYQEACAGSTLNYAVPALGEGGTEL